MKFQPCQIEHLAVTGAQLVTFELHQDTRGLLYEVIHASDDFVPYIRQVYVVVDPRPDTIRAFHAHERLIDWFHIVRGSAIFCLVQTVSLTDHRPVKTAKLVLSARKPQLLVVPAGVFHGWMNLEPNTILVSIASEEYNRLDPDEIRVPPDYFDNAFRGSPWQVEAK